MRTTTAIVYRGDYDTAVDDWLSALPGSTALLCRADQAGAVRLADVGKQA